MLRGALLFSMSNVAISHFCLTMGLLSWVKIYLAQNALDALGSISGHNFTFQSLCFLHRIIDTQTSLFSLSQTPVPLSQFCYLKSQLPA